MLWGQRCGCLRWRHPRDLPLRCESPLAPKEESEALLPAPQPLPGALRDGGWGRDAQRRSSQPQSATGKVGQRRPPRSPRPRWVVGVADELPGAGPLAVPASLASAGAPRVKNPCLRITAVGKCWTDSVLSVAEVALLPELVLLSSFESQRTEFRGGVDAKAGWWGEVSYDFFVVVFVFCCCWMGDAPKEERRCSFEA